MKLSELIREYVEAKIEGEPVDRDWTSIDANYEARRRYYAKLKELDAAIDAVIDEAIAKATGEAE